ncbi:UNVERIFIED_CONTAM: hypothetical protein K2H54_069936 [Gekko kuhli]
MEALVSQQLADPCLVTKYSSSEEPRTGNALEAGLQVAGRMEIRICGREQEGTRRNRSAIQADPRAVQQWAAAPGGWQA